LVEVLRPQIFANTVKQLPLRPYPQSSILSNIADIADFADFADFVSLPI